MTREEQVQHITKFMERMRDTLLSKGDDYANNADRLQNFKLVGSLTKQTPAQVAFGLMAVKMARLSELLSGKTPNHESIEDSLLDLANYAVLTAECFADKK